MNPSSGPICSLQSTQDIGYLDLHSNPIKLGPDHSFANRDRKLPPARAPPTRGPGEGEWRILVVVVRTRAPTGGSGLEKDPNLGISRLLDACILLASLNSIASRI